MNLPQNGSVPPPQTPTIGIRLLWDIGIAVTPDGKRVIQFINPRHSFDNFGSPVPTPELIHQAISMLGQAVQELSNMEAGLRAQQEQQNGGIQIVRENQLGGMDLRGSILKRG